MNYFIVRPSGRRVIDLTLARVCLSETQDMAITVANRELTHLIGLLDNWTVDNGCHLFDKLVMESDRIVDPEEGVPGPTLRLYRPNEIGIRSPPKHDGEAVSAADRELRR